MAPSPTGYFHIGSARTALFSYLFARKHGGSFLLRIEDTDKERSKRELETSIYDAMSWLGLSYDGEALRQSERTAIYTSYLEKMIAEGTAYVSKETPVEPGGRTEVIRFKNPNRQVTFHDEIRGDITFDTTELKDFVIAKSLEEPLYHLAVVIDDHEMAVTHVIRGEDHISNTPRQILLQEAIGAMRPIYAHLPLILAPDKSKMSKRKHGETVSIGYYKEQGYLPEAMINFLALIGWNPGTDREIFSLDELVEGFSLERVQKSGAVFNVEKLNWLNREYIKKLPRERVSAEIEKVFPDADKATLEKIEPLILDRIATFADIRGIKESGEFDFFFGQPGYETSLLKTPEFLPETRQLLEKLEPKTWNLEPIKEALWEFATEKGRGKVLWPLRVALTGKEKSPDPFTVAALIGKEETLKRIDHAIEIAQHTS